MLAQFSCRRCLITLAAGVLLAGCGGHATTPELSKIPETQNRAEDVVSDSAIASPEFVYVANRNDGIPNRTSYNVSSYKINAVSGALTSVWGLPFTQSRPIALTAVPSGKFLYVLSEFTGVRGYEINPTNGVLRLSTSASLAGTLLYDVAVDPLGKFVYVLSLNKLWVYAINSTSGALTQTSGSPFAVSNGLGGANLAVDLANVYVTSLPGHHCIGRPSHCYYHDAYVWGYGRNLTTGAISVGAGRADLGRTAALGMAVHPSGAFVYVPTVTGVKVYTNSLAPVQSTSSASGRITIDRSGNFAYIACNSGVLAYTINRSNGMLTPVVGSPFPPGSGDVAVDSLGKFVYTTSGGVSGYVVYTGSGPLKNIIGSPFAPSAPGSSPYRIVVAR